MKRMTQYTYINQALAEHITAMKMQASKGFTDLNRASEFFYADLLNLVFDKELKSVELDHPNTASFDLRDATSALLVQVSSDDSRTKIEHSLSRDILRNYPEHSFWFLFLVEKKKNYQSKEFANPFNLKFDGNKDIYTAADIAQRTLSLPPEKRNAVFELVREEFGQAPNIAKVPSNLATIIEALSKAGSPERSGLPEVKPFEIERKISFNKLDSIQEHIRKYSIYYQKLDALYATFDAQANNKSAGVLNCINNIYLKHDREYDNKGDLFYKIVDEMTALVQNSANYSEMPFEDLSDGVYAVAVDAFIRCKIFKNPADYAPLTTGNCESGEYASS